MEDFSDISLDLTRDCFGAGDAVAAARAVPAPAGMGKGGGMGVGDGGGFGAAETLASCLRAFTGVESLGSDERCWCDSCKTLQDS